MTFIITVNSIKERDYLVSQIRRNFEVKLIDNPNLEMVQKSVNKIQVFHVTKNTRTLVRSIVVIVLSIIINLNQLEGVYDEKIIYDFSNTFKEINKIVGKLKAIKESQKPQIRKDSKALLKALDDAYDGQDF